MTEKSILNPSPFLCSWQIPSFNLEISAQLTFSSWPADQAAITSVIVFTTLCCYRSLVFSLFLNGELTKDSSDWESFLISQCLAFGNSSVTAYQTGGCSPMDVRPWDSGRDHPRMGWHSLGGRGWKAWTEGGPELRPLPFYAAEFVAVLPGHEQPAAPGSLWGQRQEGEGDSDIEESQTNHSTRLINYEGECKWWQAWVCLTKGTYIDCTASGHCNYHLSLLQNSFQVNLTGAVWMI